MKVLGYVFCALAAVIGALMLLDQLFLETAHQIWDILNWVNCIALALCVILGIRNHITERTDAIAPGVLLSVFAFIVYTETWVAYMAASDLPAMQWLWVDTIAVIALLHVGTSLIAKE